MLSRSGRWATLRNDRTLFLICLLIALIFWLFVKLSGEYETELELALQYECPPALTFQSPPLTRGKALVRGSGWNLLYSHVKRSHDTAYIDLSTRNAPSRITVELSEQSRFNPGSNLKVLSFSPKLVELQLDSLERRQLPLLVPQDLHFVEGYHLQQAPLLNPDSVWVQGPSSLLSELKYWETDTLKLRQLKSDQQTRISVLQYADQSFQVEPQQVKVRIQVEPIVEQSLFVPVTVQNAPNSYRVFPASVRLTFVVGMSRINSIQASDFELTADVKDLVLSSDNTLVPLNLTRKPEDARGVRYSPQFVEIILQLDGN